MEAILYTHESPNNKVVIQTKRGRRSFAAIEPNREPKMAMCSPAQKAVLVARLRINAKG